MAYEEVVEMNPRGIILAIIALALMIVLLFITSNNPPKPTFEGTLKNVTFITEPGALLSPPVEMTIIEMADGRIKTFSGISKATFQKGKVNKITYSDHDQSILAINVFP